MIEWLICLKVLRKPPNSVLAILCCSPQSSSTWMKNDFNLVLLSPAQAMTVGASTGGAAGDEQDLFFWLYSELCSLDAWATFKTSLFYVLLTACTIQTFYPIFMIIAMVIRQMGIFAHFFHKVSQGFSIGGDIPPCLNMRFLRFNGLSPFGQVCSD